MHDFRRGFFSGFSLFILVHPPLHMPYNYLLRYAIAPLGTKSFGTSLRFLAIAFLAPFIQSVLCLTTASQFLFFTSTNLVANIRTSSSKRVFFLRYFLPEFVFGFCYRKSFLHAPAGPISSFSTHVQSALHFNVPYGTLSCPRLLKLVASCLTGSLLGAG